MLIVKPYKNVGVIFAKDVNNVIGVGGVLPWNIKGDLQRFKSVTENGIVVMGRKTWDSLPIKPLKNRVNVVLTSKPSVVPGQDCVSANYVEFGSLELALEFYIFWTPDKPIWIIGGKRVIEEALPYASHLHITTVIDYIPSVPKHEVKNITQINPIEISLSDWVCMSSHHSEVVGDNPFSYVYNHYARIETLYE